MSFVVREMGLEPTRLWLDTGTSSLPVCLFQHSRIGYALSNAKFIIARKEYLSRKRSSNDSVNLKLVKCLTNPNNITFFESNCAEKSLGSGISIKNGRLMLKD